MFIGAFELSAAWSEDGVKGCRRFLERVWKLQDILTEADGYSADLETKMHQTIKKVSGDFENLKYNTAIAAMMSLINDFYKKNAVTRGEFRTLLTLLNPVAPHITEELWELVGFEGKVYQALWPEFEEAKTIEATVEIAVQVNGKVRAAIQVASDISKEDAVAAGKEAVKDKINGTIVKEILPVKNTGLIRFLEWPRVFLAVRLAARVSNGWSALFLHCHQLIDFFYFLRCGIFAEGGYNRFDFLVIERDILGFSFLGYGHQKRKHLLSRKVLAFEDEHLQELKF